MSQNGKRDYVRDGRAPIPERESISHVMSANKAKNTKPELLMRNALRKIGLRGYRLHWNKAPGRPDIAFPSRKIAVFVNGCYWHRCPECNMPLPRSNTEWWKAKFQRNIERDAQKSRRLEEEGWKVLVIWECEAKKDAIGCAKKVQSLFESVSSF